ncbi:ankyrin repeat-containing domain protein [Ilyonectria robusta]|uniref:ankyrin repeat-containing domain protein n=1 Tax=Ilyonectria robusta TaxID=1079257 RepID=UPI001E8CA59C|nr:ankyrin repeat-containing domain protein [Ilyonectria robusta]KAH8654691.1 ankyrin repeat-containing domain protein [Ilyonectria robusta]
MAGKWLKDKLSKLKRKKKGGQSGTAAPTTQVRSVADTPDSPGGKPQPTQTTQVATPEPEPQQAAPSTARPASPVRQPPPAQPSPPSPAPAASLPEASSDTRGQPIVSDTPLTSNDTDPWTRAYEIFRGREPELMADYQKHLASLQDDAAAGGDLSTPRSVESMINKLLEDREKRQWRVSLLGKDVKIREQVERLAKFLLWSDPIVKTAVSTQPYAALAWSGVLLLLPLLTSGTTQNEAMLKGFNSIGDVQVYWKFCEKTYLESSHREKYQDLVEPLAQLYSHIIEYQALVICHLSKAQLSRAWKDVAGYDWAGRARDIDDLSKRRSDCIPPLQEEEIRERWNRQLQEMQESRTILDEIRRILKEGGMQTQKIYEDQKERDLLRDLASDYEGNKNFNPQRVPGTCQWFFNDDRFRKWRDSNTSSLLWVSAGPGCGKSVLSRALIDERLSTNVATSTVCYFFFKDGDERRMHSADALCAILHQLFAQDPSGSLIGNALPSHKKFEKALAQNFSGLWRILLECAGSSDVGEIVCILDALDECEWRSREELIKQLKDFYCPSEGLSSPSSKLKFLVTSRPYDHLEALFRAFSTTEYLRLDGDEKSADIGREINLVIDARVNEITGNLDPDDRRKISECLKSKNSRTYLWLYLVFDTVKEKLSRYSKLSSIETLLSDIPSKLHDAYEKILSRNQDEAETEILLQLILAAARPLTLDEANVALTLALQARFASHAELESGLWTRDNFRSVVTNLCGLFISVYDSKLSFIHQTAREFLIHKKRQGTWQGRLNMSESHTAISRSCLDYLMLPDIDIPAGDDCPEDKQPPFLSYAATHWPLHYISQEAAAADRSRKDARMLCNTAGHQASIWAPTYLSQRYLRWGDWTDLTLASFLSLKLVVEDILLKEKTDVNTKGGRYGTALQAASERGHKEVVEMLLDKGADVNIEGGAYGTALQAASARGHKEIVEMLLDKGADVNIEGGDYGTALQAASARGHKEIVEMLLDKGADVNIEGGDYGMALQAASAEGHKEVVEMLLDKGADVNIEGGDYGTALQAASARGHKEVVEMLLDKGADVNIEGGRYGMALQAASAQGDKEVVEMLLDKGADVNIEGGDYGTALQAASARGHKEIVEMLLDKGADVNIEGGDYGMALQAASAEGHKEVVEMLLDKGADVNIEGGDYGTALQAASARGHKEVVEMLLDKGADVNIEGGDYGTALQAASARGHKEIVEMLLDKGADVNIEGGAYGTALQAASARGHKEIVEMLLDKGADVNIEGGDYGTALQAASARGHKEIVEMLLDKGADVNIEGGDYGMALQAASAEGHKEVVEMLLDKGADAGLD